MKKMKWKGMLLLFATLTTMLFTTMTVHAKTYTSNYECIYYPTKMICPWNNQITGKKEPYNVRFIYWKGYQSASIKNLKSSNTSVAKASVKKSKKYGNCVYIIPRKPGTTTVTFRIGSDNFKRKYTFKKYVPHIKTVKIAGKEIGSKFKTCNWVILPYKQYAGKKVTLSSIKFTSGWRTYENNFYTGVYKDYSLTNQSIWYTGEKIKVTKNLVFGCFAYNSKTGKSEYYYISFK